MTSRTSVREIETPIGLARAHLSGPTGAASRGLFALGHGAGGGIEAADLLAVTAEVTAAGWTVARIEQPYRVKGRRAPEAPPRLDLAWTATVRALRARRKGLLVLAGRSSGARVACRTAAACGADGVVALAFPLHPPGKPDKSRVDELLAVGVPALVVQGERDAFGTPDELPSPLPSGITVARVPGDHSLKQAPDRVASAVNAWLAGIA